MTIENEVYATGWIKCELCGVTQPKASLKDAKCINTVKCNEWKAALEDQKWKAIHK